MVSIARAAEGGGGMTLVMIFTIAIPASLLAIVIALHGVLPHFKNGQRWLCSHGFHSSLEDGEVTEFDGASLHVKCRRCGKECLVDSQGNLF